MEIHHRDDPRSQSLTNGGGSRLGQPGRSDGRPPDPVHRRDPVEFLGHFVSGAASDSPQVDIGVPVRHSMQAESLMARDSQ